MAGKRPPSSGRNTSAFSRTPSRIGTSTSFSMRSLYAPRASWVTRAPRAAGVRSGPRNAMIRSVHLDLHFIGDLLPAGDLAVQPGLRVLERGIRADGDQLLGEGFLQLRRLGGFEDRLVQGGEHLLRGAG